MGVQKNIRNISVIAHVDHVSFCHQHGDTRAVDGEIARGEFFNTREKKKKKHIDQGREKGFFPLCDEERFLVCVGEEGGGVGAHA